jgi:hypothetical protein
VKTISGPIPYIGTYRFTDLGGRTRFTLTAEAEPSRFFRLAHAVLDRRINREIEASLANLKDLMQAHVEHQVP